MLQTQIRHQQLHQVPRRLRFPAGSPPVLRFMYAPVAVVEPAAVELSVLPLAAGPASPVKRMEQQATDTTEAETAMPTRRSRRKTIALRAAVALVLVALVVALGLAAARFVHSDAFDGFVRWLQVSWSARDALEGSGETDALCAICAAP